MAGKKNRTYSTKGFKTKEEKEKEKMTVHIGKSTPHLISAEQQQRAKAIAGVHNSKENKRGTKSPESRKGVRVRLRKEDW